MSEADGQRLQALVRAYLSEYDAAIPDYTLRRSLREQMQALFEK